MSALITNFCTMNAEAGNFDRPHSIFKTFLPFPAVLIFFFLLVRAFFFRRFSRYSRKSVVAFVRPSAHLAARTIAAPTGRIL